MEWVGVVADLLLVVATGTYATLAFLMLREMRLSRKRQHIPA